MSITGVKIASNYKTESVFIDPRKNAGDKVIKDEEGNIVDVIVGGNIITKDVSAKKALNKVYGK